MIGKSIEKFGSNSLKDIDILRLYAGFISPRMTESAKITKILEEVNEFYRQRNIQTKSIETIRIKIKRLVSSFKNLLGKRKVKSMKERQRQEIYVEDRHKYFNVTLGSTEQMDQNNLSSSNE